MYKKCSLYHLVGDCLQHYACPFDPPDKFPTERSYLEHLNQMMDEEMNEREDLPASPSDQLPSYLYKSSTEKRMEKYMHMADECTEKNYVQWKKDDEDLVECDLLQLIHYYRKIYEIDPPTLYTSEDKYLEHVYKQLPSEWFQDFAGVLGGPRRYLETVLRDKIKNELSRKREQYSYYPGAGSYRSPMYRCIDYLPGYQNTWMQ